jgi:hypothetical protein
MSKIQFHATPDEIIYFIKECINVYDLHAVILESFPSFKAVLLNEVSQDSDITLRSKLSTIIFLFTQKPDMVADNEYEFLDNNPNNLYICIGRYCDNELWESLIGSITKDVEILKLWKRIIKKFKSRTICGAWIVNPDIDYKAFDKNRRYTQEAKNLYLDGVKIVPFGGGNYFILSEQH